MPETCRDIYENKSQLLHQVGTSRHFYLLRVYALFFDAIMPEYSLKLLICLTIRVRYSPLLWNLHDNCHRILSLDYILSGMI